MYNVSKNYVIKKNNPFIEEMPYVQVYFKEIQYRKMKKRIARTTNRRIFKTSVFHLNSWLYFSLQQ